MPMEICDKESIQHVRTDWSVAWTMDLDITPHFMSFRACTILEIILLEVLVILWYELDSWSKADIVLNPLTAKVEFIRLGGGGLFKMVQSVSLGQMRSSSPPFLLTRWDDCQKKFEGDRVEGKCQTFPSVTVRGAKLKATETNLTCCEKSTISR